MQMASLCRDNVLTRALSRISFRLYLLTWNVNGKAPPDDLANLLELDDPPLPDLYVVGLQEVSGYGWEEAFTLVLHRKNFVRVKSRKLLGIQTFLFVARPMLPFVSNVESELTKTGLWGYWGNKGSATVRLDFKGVNIVVVNCHLAAHREEVMARIEDITAIIEGQKFKDPDSDTILDHDYVFWIGDMNFRLEEISRDHALEVIESGSYSNLLKYDQLNMVRNENLIFENFQEGPITFPPTYKFDNGTDQYDTSEKQRVPAYTDRILYFHHDTDYGPVKLDTDLISYRYHPDYKMSDHRPVSGLIAFRVPSVCTRSPITFNIENNRRSKEGDNSFKYTIRKDFVTHADDWIGLYKRQFKDLDCYLKYQWVSQAKFLRGKVRQASITFLASQTNRLDDGFYILCYMTRKGSICGISDEFVLTSTL